MSIALSTSLTPALWWVLVASMLYAWVMTLLFLDTCRIRHAPRPFTVMGLIAAVYYTIQLVIAGYFAINGQQVLVAINPSFVASNMIVAGILFVGAKYMPPSK